MENRRKQLRVFFACFLRSSSRAQRAAQQLAANYYGFAGFPEFMFVFFFGPFSEARLTGFFNEVLFGSAFFKKWSFLGIVRNFYFINILRVVLLMICITMAAKRGVRLPIIAC